MFPLNRMCPPCWSGTNFGYQPTASLGITKDCFNTSCNGIPSCVDIRFSSSCWSSVNSISNFRVFTTGDLLSHCPAWCDVFRHREAVCTCHDFRTILGIVSRLQLIQQSARRLEPIKSWLTLGRLPPRRLVVAHLGVTPVYE